MNKKKQPFEGLDILRAATYWSNNRPEHMNANKSAIQIINEFKKQQESE